MSLDLQTIQRNLGDLPVSWSFSTFGPALIHVRGKDDWNRLSVYVHERDFEEFSSELPIIMSALPVWKAMSRFCLAGHAQWISGYMTVKKKLLPEDGTYMPRRMFNPDQYIQASDPNEALAFRKGMQDFLDQFMLRASEACDPEVGEEEAETDPSDSAA